MGPRGQLLQLRETNLGAREWFDFLLTSLVQLNIAQRKIAATVRSSSSTLSLGRSSSVPLNFHLLIFQKGEEYIFGYCFEIKNDHKRVCSTNNKVGTELLDPSWLLTLCLVLVLPKAETTDSTCRLGFCFDLPKQRQLQTAVVNSTFCAIVPTPIEVF